MPVSSALRFSWPRMYFYWRHCIINCQKQAACEDVFGTEAGTWFPGNVGCVDRVDLGDLSMQCFWQFGCWASQWQSLIVGGCGAKRAGNEHRAWGPYILPGLPTGAQNHATVICSYPSPMTLAIRGLAGSSELLQCSYLHRLCETLYQVPRPPETLTSPTSLFPYNMGNLGESAGMACYLSVCLWPSADGVVT